MISILSVMFVAIYRAPGVTILEVRVSPEAFGLTDTTSAKAPVSELWAVRSPADIAATIDDTDAERGAHTYVDATSIHFSTSWRTSSTSLSSSAPDESATAIID